MKGGKYYVCYIDHNNKFTIIGRAETKDKAIDKSTSSPGSKVFELIHTTHKKVIK